ncbi:hypothetical protein D3C77_287060 [compost metagenome]
MFDLGLLEMVWQFEQQIVDGLSDAFQRNVLMTITTLEAVGFREGQPVLPAIGLLQIQRLSVQYGLQQDLQQRL